MTSQQLNRRLCEAQLNHFYSATGGMFNTDGNYIRAKVWDMMADLRDNQGYMQCVAFAKSLKHYGFESVVNAASREVFKKG